MVSHLFLLSSEMMQSFLGAYFPSPAESSSAASGPKDVLTEVAASTRNEVEWPRQDLHLLAQDGWRAMTRHMANVLTRTHDERQLEELVEENEEWEARRKRVVARLREVEAVLENCLLKCKGVEVLGKNRTDELNFGTEARVAKRLTNRLRKVASLTAEVVALVESVAQPKGGNSWTSESEDADVVENANAPLEQNDGTVASDWDKHVD